MSKFEKLLHRFLEKPTDFTWQKRGNFMKNMMQYKGYHGSINFDAETPTFYGKIEFIRALISYEADNAKDLKKEFERAVNDYLRMCKQQKITPETPFKGSLNIRLGAELHREVALCAAKHHISINKFITDILSQAVHKE